MQLAVSAAACTSLPDHLEFLLSETYNWFAHSTTRQLNYKILYNTLNNGIDPLKIVRVSSTRWLSIEVAVSRILNQWNDLKDHFRLVGSNDHCYKAKTLYNMFNDKNNLLYFTFLKPILGEAQHINQMFQSNSADRTKLLNSLTYLIESLAKKVVTPACREDLLTANIQNFLHPNPYLGYDFEEQVKKIKPSPETEKVVRSVCINFIVELVSQLQQRLPSNITILKQSSFIAPDTCLNTVKPSIIPLAKSMHYPEENLGKLESQWYNLSLIKWTNITSTADLWAEINLYTDGSGLNPFKELVNFAKTILVLPWSNAEIERWFSQMSIIKNAHRNRMSTFMANAILTIKAGLKRKGECCDTYNLPQHILKQIGNILLLLFLFFSFLNSNINKIIYKFRYHDRVSKRGKHKH